MTKEAKALAKIDASMSAAARSHNLDLMVSSYTEDAVLYPPNEPWVSGSAGIKGFWSALITNPNMEGGWVPTHAEVSSSGDMGYTTGEYTLAFKSADGKTSQEKGKYLEVWKKNKEGQWKLIRDMFSPNSK
jgi:ketosteroid isomerase-like protein